MSVCLFGLCICLILCLLSSVSLSICRAYGFNMSGSPFFTGLSSNLPEHFVRSAVFENPIWVLDI